MKLLGLHRKKPRTEIVIKTDKRLTNSQVEALKQVAKQSGIRIVSDTRYEELEMDAARKRQLGAEVIELRKRPTKEAYDALNARLSDALGTITPLQAELGRLRPQAQKIPSLEKENERLKRQNTNQQGAIKNLQGELDRARGDIRTLSGFAGDAIQAYLGFYKLAHESPPLDSTVALCGTDINGVIASAQFARAGVTVGYCPPRDLHNLLPQLKIRETKNIGPRVKGTSLKDVVVKEVVIVGPYLQQGTSGLISQLNSLYLNDVRIVVVTDSDLHLPEFVTVYKAASLAEAVSSYLHAIGTRDTSERLWTLGQREEGRYLADALKNPLTNTRFVRAVVDQLSHTEELQGTPIYNGVRRRAEQSSVLRKYGVRI